MRSVDRNRYGEQEEQDLESRETREPGASLLPGLTYYFSDVVTVSANSYFTFTPLLASTAVGQVSSTFRVCAELTFTD